MEKVGHRQGKMEGYCLTGQSQQWAVVPMEGEEDVYFNIYVSRQHTGRRKILGRKVFLHVCNFVRRGKTTLVLLPSAALEAQEFSKMKLNMNGQCKPQNFPSDREVKVQRYSQCTSSVKTNKVQSMSRRKSLNLIFLSTDKCYLKLADLSYSYDLR